MKMGPTTRFRSPCQETNRTEGILSRTQERKAGAYPPKANCQYTCCREFERTIRMKNGKTMRAVARTVGRRHAAPVQTKPSTVKTTSHVRTARLETTVASENVFVHHAIMFHSSASWQARAMGTSHTSRRKGVEAIRSASFMVL